MPNFIFVTGKWDKQRKDKGTANARGVKANFNAPDYINFIGVKGLWEIFDWANEKVQLKFLGLVKSWVQYPTG